MPRSTTLAVATPGSRATIIDTEVGRPRYTLPGTSQRPPRGPEDTQTLRLIDKSNRPLRVLVVDDDPAVAVVLEDMITAAGGESVGIITSALAAIGAAAVISPDVVLMDVRLPGAMDGIEAAGIIQTRGSAAVVIITGAASDPEIRSRLRSLEEVEIIVKPVLENELCAAILRASSAR
jgi:CheY-like chemotaxis protein